MTDKGTRIAALTLALLLSSLLSAPVQAAVEVDPNSREILPLNDLRIVDGEVLLTVEEAVRIALERNLSLMVERHRQEESELSLKQQFGIYDYNATIFAFANEENSPAASNLDGALIQISEFQQLDLGVNRLFSGGGRGRVDFNNSRRDTNSQFATLNPAHTVNLDFNWNQPLLRDFGSKTTNRGIRIARTNLSISRETFETQVTFVIQLVEDAYWTLVDANEQFIVAEESLGLAQQLHEQNRIRVEVGTLAPLELVQSEAGVATREEEIIRARGAIGDAEDRLRQLLNFDDNSNLWTAPIITETPAEMEPIEIDLAADIETALSRRPDLRSKRLSQGDLEEDIGYFRNQRKPRLDLDLTFGFNGLGGDVTDRDFLTGEIRGMSEGGYEDAIDQITDTAFEGWAVAVNAAIPVQNRFGKAAVALAEVGFERGAAELADQELGVRTDVRRLARFVDTARQARESARVSRRLEERNLEAEQKRHENGMSTSYRVLDIQEDLTQARQREVGTITSYRKAVVLYHQATGELIDMSGVMIVDAE